MRRRQRNIGGVWAALSVGVMLLAGCGPGPDGNSGGDEDRAKAAEIALATVVDGRVSPGDGDATDWFRVRLDAPGSYTVSIYWDTRDVEATVSAFDTFGNELGSVTHAPGAPVDYLPVSCDGEHLFFRIQAEEGASVYSVEILQGQVAPAGGGGSRPYTDPRPE